MIIGFNKRQQTVSENDGFGSFFFLLVDVIALRASEREHEMLFRLLFSGTATVMPFFSGDINVDAFFGNSDFGEILVQLPRGNMAAQLETAIINDFAPEDEECYSIQIIPVDTAGVREIFTCNENLQFFCEHTICIEDDDGKILSGNCVYLSLWFFSKNLFQSHLRLDL